MRLRKLKDLNLIFTFVPNIRTNNVSADPSESEVVLGNYQNELVN